MNEFSRWNVNDALQAAANVVIIVGGIGVGLWTLNNARSDAIADNRAALVQVWTNEGDILATETRFITLELQDYSGDLIGTLRGPGFDATFDVQVDVGWRSSELHITELRGRSAQPVGTVKVKLLGNHNRLQWELDDSSPDYLPRSTALWISPSL